VERRVSETSLGFRAKPQSKISNTAQRAALLHQTTPEDLMKHGFIPEFIGRLPVTATLEPLDTEALVNILTEPRNALTKQYSKMLHADGVELKFAPEALRLIAERAMERRTGARALRSILEETMTNVMYEVPSQKGIAQCVVDEETIRDRSEPKLITREQLLHEGREERAREDRTREERGRKKPLDSIEVEAA
jgi:ATP-dependent Clp protease ATP-binding subunit ClpX